ncbi:Tyrosine recombinase XerC [subsurface metagenome]
MKRQKTPVVLTREEVEKLIEVGAGIERFCKKKLMEEKLKGSKSLNYLKNNIFLTIRNQAIIRLLFSTGIRNSEACNLNDEDIYFEENRIKIRAGKRGNDEYQPLTKDETWKELRRYLRARKAFKYNRGNAFFIGKNGERVNPRELQRFVKEYGKGAGIQKQVYPHILRHSFATEYLRTTRDLRLTQNAMRHKNLMSTIVYTYVSKDDVANGLEKANL